MSRILIVERDEILRLSHHRLLSDDGFEVVSTNSADEGVRLCYELDIDLVICDCRASSLRSSFIERLHLMFPELPILALSGGEEQALRRHALNDGASAFLQRPCSHACLVSSASQLLHTSQDAPHAQKGPRLVDSR